MTALSPLHEKLLLLDEIDKRAARDSFLRFYQRMTGFFPPKHVKLLAKLLQSMETDKIDRAMVFMPPRHAKTLLCTKLFPAWLIGRDPRSYHMIVAHTQDYAKEIGREIRGYLRSPEYPWPEVELAEDSQAKDRWRTTVGGEVNTFGAGAGNQHGRPAQWLYMDDIVKGRDMAMSALQRETIWSNYLTDLRSRLQGRRKQLMVYTRWHQDDPAGRILPDDWDGKTGWVEDRNTGEAWYVLCLPAVCDRDDDPLGRKPGDWLWPEEFGEDVLGYERKRGGYFWSALYQQRPSPEEGLLFSAQHIEQRYSLRNIDLTQMEVYTSHDYAVTEEAGAHDPDYTVHMVWGVDPEFNIYLLDMWRGRTLSDEWVGHALRLWSKWKPLRAVEEGGQIIKSVGPFLKQQMRKHGVFVDRVQINSSSATGNKEQRAHALLGLMALGQVYLPQRDECAFLDHLDAFEKELMQFPTGRHDDTVDAATLFGRFVDRIVEGRRPARPPRSNEHGPSLDDLWAAQEQDEGGAW